MNVIKAVILAAGEGKRMRPLTLVKPKPLLEVRGRTILEHIFEALPEEVHEVYIVVKYLREQIENFLKGKFPHKKIMFVEGSSLGNAYSFLAAKPYIGANERFLVIHGDDLPSRNEMRECLKHERSVLVCESAEPENCGVIALNQDGTIQQILEKPPHPQSNRVAGGVMVFSGDIFGYEPKASPGGEYFLTSLVSEYCKNFPVHPVYTGPCRQFSSPADLKTIEQVLDKRL